MGTNPQHDEPLWFLDTVCVGLWVSQGLDLDGVGFLDFVGCSVADEDGLASPFDNDLLCLVCQFGAHWGGEVKGGRTFLPSGMAERSTSTLAIARTSAEADILTRKSTAHHQ